MYTEKRGVPGIGDSLVTTPRLLEINTGSINLGVAINNDE